MWFLALAAIFAFGRVWFHLVEGILARIRSLLNRHMEPPVWHTFAETDDETGCDAAASRQEQKASQLWGRGESHIDTKARRTQHGSVGTVSNLE